MKKCSEDTSSLLSTEHPIGLDIKTLEPLALSKSELSKVLNIPIDQLEKSDNWYTDLENIYYVKKRALIKNIINELLGEYLSEYMDLPTIKQSLLLGDDKVLGLVSENFRTKGIKYIKANDLSFKEHDKVNKILLSRPILVNQRHKREMANYIMRNFYANQADRVYNVLCYYRKSGIYLAPLYDYEMSFFHPDDTLLVDSYFLGIDITPNLINHLVQIDFNMRDSVDKILEFDMVSALEYISNYYGINLPQQLSKYYLDYDEKRKALIKEKIIR